MSPSHSLHARQTWSRAADASEIAAWRPPSSARFDTRVANDPAAPEPTLKDLIAELPDWVTVVVGGLIAALLGAVLGGALAV